MSNQKVAVYSFVPVIHSGYLNFFEQNIGDLFIFSDNLIKQYVHLTRDLRLIDPTRIKLGLDSLLSGRNIEVADPQKLIDYDVIIMPDDEICHDVAEKYFTAKIVKFDNIFLRWNKVLTFKELEISPERVITEEKFHREMIRKASELTKKSDDWWRQIAAIAVKDNKTVLEAYNHHLPTSYHQSINGDPRSNFDAGQHQNIYTTIHAEAELVAKAAKDGVSLKGVSIYTTTFPCPNCARLIGTAGIHTVYYAKGYSLLDAEKILEHFGVKIILVK